MGEAFGKLWFIQESKIGQSLLLYFVRIDKKQQEIKIKCAQKHFKNVLGHHTKYQKETKLKKLLKMANLVLQKGTKESKISLGSWLVVWAANEIYTFLEEYETLNYSKRNYLISKLQIFIKMLAKRG